MREIKFRVWDKANKVMGTVNCYDFDEDKVFYTAGGITYSQVSGHIILMQYTGIKDKNGKDIYEGDTLMAASYMCYVTWCDKRAAWAVVYPESFANSEQKDLLSNYQHDIHLEIIGNEWENPELLKKKQ